MRTELTLSTSLYDLIRTNAAMYTAAVASLERVNAPIDSQREPSTDERVDSVQAHYNLNN